MIHRLALSQAPVQPWRNGGGSTRELLAWPRPEAWSLRISVAEITRDGPFSAFAGMQRWFAVLHGEGVRLQLGDEVVALTPADAPRAFDGAAAPGCSLLGGPTQDLNLMLRHDAGSGRMTRVTPGEAWFSTAPLRAVYTQDPAQLHIEDHPVVTLPADTLAWRENAAGQRWQLQGPHATAPRALWLEFKPCQP